VVFWGIVVMAAITLAATLRIPELVRAEGADDVSRAGTLDLHA
jgi:hypothetical protein